MFSIYLSFTHLAVECDPRAQLDLVTAAKGHEVRRQAGAGHQSPETLARVSSQPHVSPLSPGLAPPVKSVQVIPRVLALARTLSWKLQDVSKKVVHNL